MFDHFHFLYLLNGLVDDPFNDDWYFFLDYFLSYYLYLHNFGNFHSPLHYLFHNFGHFNHFLPYFLHFHYLLNDSVDILDDFHWNVDYLLHLLNLSVIDDLLDYLFNRHNSGNLNHSLNHFLNYFWHFHYLLIDLEHFEYVIS